MGCERERPVTSNADNAWQETLWNQEEVQLRKSQILCRFHRRNSRCPKTKTLFHRHVAERVCNCESIGGTQLQQEVSVVLATCVVQYWSAKRIRTKFEFLAGLTRSDSRIEVPNDHIGTTTRLPVVQRTQVSEKTLPFIVRLPFVRGIRIDNRYFVLLALQLDRAHPI